MLKILHSREISELTWDYSRNSLCLEESQRGPQKILIWMAKCRRSFLVEALKVQECQSSQDVEQLHTVRYEEVAGNEARKRLRSDGLKIH